MRKSCKQAYLITISTLLLLLPRALTSDLPAGKLPKGHQAVGLRIQQENIAANVTKLPRTYVDIVERRRSGKTVVLVKNVLVLAAENHTQRDQAGRTRVFTVVTVALKPEDVLKLELMKIENSIELASKKS
jgi:Flp pilus assembly protein CpaB